MAARMILQLTLYICMQQCMLKSIKVPLGFYKGIVLSLKIQLEFCHCCNVYCIMTFLLLLLDYCNTNYVGGLACYVQLM